MDDAHLVEQVANEYVRRYGSMAVQILLERAEADKAAGDEPSAKAWRDIAEAASRIPAERERVPESRGNFLRGP